MLRDGGPWGSAFPEPCFDGRFHVLETRIVGATHLKLLVRAARDARPIDAIAFGWLARPGRRQPRPQSEVDLVYRLDVNEYQGLRRPQLLIEHLEPVAGDAPAGSPAGA